MFGSIMQLKVGSMTIRLAPFAREDVGEYIKNGGMQSHNISRYLGNSTAYVLEDEQEWFDSVRKDAASLVWGIWDCSDPKKPKLIGNSSLTELVYNPMKQAVSGSLIHDQSYWRKGIATSIHKARTFYAFEQMNLDRIKSAVAFPNIGSRKALEHSGYNLYSVGRNFKFVDGELVHSYNLECINPRSWDAWWHGDTPSPEAEAARNKVKEALSWARANVKFV